MGNIQRRFRICRADGSLILGAHFQRHCQAQKAAQRATETNNSTLIVFDTMARQGTIFATRFINGEYRRFLSPA
jgi:hypothetical protein